jgi:serine phosphatase RsbU (regulator of sigma subunit)
MAKGELGVDISQQLYSLLDENQSVLATQDPFGFTDHSLDASIFGFPVTQSPGVQQSWFLVLRDQHAALQQSREVMQSRLITGAILFIVVLIAMVGLINYAFNGIAKAISVLQALIKGDDSVSIEQGSHWLRSEDDEIARLSEALEAYRSHLIEMEDNKLYQQYNRQQRDAIMMDKMRLLADQLDGEAKRLILSDVAKMQHIANSRPKEGSEDASVELMSVAFSRMSQEVVTLLDARTQEMQQAYEQASTANREIQSSINYAAKLQRALLKAERFPEDVTIDVTWQPRDVVGGDIYVVRTIGSKTIIAVIDCTGHGVPGAFTSVIARAVIDRAIEDDSITSAGSYQSTSNRLIKDMLFQHGAEASDSDAGFDGTICILDRDADKLEFAGANSSLFMVNHGKIAELKGDRKSVGARRTKGSYEFTTQVVDRPSGMFVMLTDGVTDVMNALPRPTAFGRKRLMSLMKALETKDPKVLTSGIMEAVNGYRGDSELRDDLTLLAFYIDQLKQSSQPPSLKPEAEVELNY